MMSLVRMALLLLSSWLVCHSFVSSIPSVSSATRLYSRRQSSADRDLRDAVPLEDDSYSPRIPADYQSNSLPILQELSAGQFGGRLVIIRPPVNRPRPIWDPPRLFNLSTTISPFIDNSDEAPFSRPPSSRPRPTWDPFRQTAIEVQVRDAGGDMDTQGNTGTQDNRSPLQLLQSRLGSFPVTAAVGRVRFVDPRRLRRPLPYWDPARMESSSPTISPFIDNSGYDIDHVRFVDPRRLSRPLPYWDPARMGSLTTMAPLIDNSHEEDSLQPSSP